MQYKEEDNNNNNNNKQNNNINKQNIDAIESDKRKKSLQVNDDGANIVKLMKNKCVGFVKDRYSLVVTSDELISCGQVK